MQVFFTGANEPIGYVLPMYAALQALLNLENTVESLICQPCTKTKSLQFYTNSIMEKEPSRRT